jgi:hypothetical protein
MEVNPAVKGAQPCISPMPEGQWCSRFQRLNGKDLTDDRQVKELADQ